MPNPDRGIFWEFQTGPTEATWQRSVLDLEKRLDRFADRIRRGIEGTTSLSHSALEDLDVPGDHPWAFLHDGTRPATGDFDMDGFDILNVGDAIQFDITSTPVIDQERAAVDEDGVDMIVRSQQGGAMSSSGTFGGDLRLISGDGYGDLSHSYGPGKVFLECGTGNVVGSLGKAEVNFYQPVKLNGDTLDTEDGDIELGTGQLTSDTAGVLFADDADLQGNNLLDFKVLRTSSFTVAGLPSYGGGTPQGLAVVTNASTGVTLCVWDGDGATPKWIDLQTGSQVTT